MSKLSKKERLEEFFERLGDAPAASTKDEGLERLTEALNSVEDEYTDVPYNPDNWQSDGRMYPPQDDQVRDVDGHPEVTRYRNLGHNTFIGENGSIEIRLGRKWKGQPPIFEKAGKDGRGVWDQAEREKEE